MALRDSNNNLRPGANMGGLISGLCVTALGLAMGLNTGGATNPVRDFGPRLAAAAFGVHNWDGQHYWAIWGPWFVPFIGGTIGAGIYKKVIKPIAKEKAEADKRRKQDEKEEEEEQQKVEEELKKAGRSNPTRVQ
jgi:glycerol uptake facilitator protein